MDTTKAKRIQEMGGLVLFALSLLLLLSLVSFTPADLPLYSSEPNQPAANWIRIVGAWVSGGLFFAIGWSSFGIPAVLFIWGLLKCLHREEKLLSVRLWGAVVLFMVLSALLSLIPVSPTFRFTLGGVTGLFVSDLLIQYFGRVGSFVLLVTLAALSLILTVNLAVFPFLVKAANALKGAATAIRFPVLRRQQSSQGSSVTLTRSGTGPTIRVPEAPQEKPQRPKITTVLPPPKTRPEPVAMSRSKPPVSPERPAGITQPVRGAYTLPSLDLLEPPEPLKKHQRREDLEGSSKVLEETLRDFGIEVRVIQVEQGPVITRYELQPAPGIKVTRITALSDDIALAMKATSVRILAPIPGKSAVGIEVPNSVSSTVTLREVLETAKFQHHSGKLTLALGKDTSGNPIVADLAEMPHLLIAGTTGAGKTVCVNAMIASLLFTYSPDELRFLMIDPKMVELAMYNGLPHLITPVVTDSKKVKGALSWMVAEMTRRYQCLAKAGVRNIASYNSKFPEEGQAPPEGLPLKLPYLIMVIDELADLMMTVPQEIEA